MKIKHQNGITIQKNGSSIILDPTKQVENGIVTHGHLDHLVKDSYMTPPTLDILEARKGEKRGEEILYGSKQDINDFEVTLFPAGHVFGSAMVKVDDVIYTGDFNPHGGKTCKRAVPYDCDTLIIESTYGKSEYQLPSKKDVTEDLIAWTEHQLDEGPVVFGTYQFGKAQEIIALLNEIGVIPYTTDKIAEISEVYNNYDIGLKYKTWNEPEGNYTAVVPPNELRKPPGRIVQHAKRGGGATTYLSGWCAFFPFYNSMDINSQFPFSDHAGFDELLDFVEKCDPNKVFTVHGSAEEFAEAVEKEHGIESEPLK
ncbi:MAG: MBL fold metallo-hydrolase RNA specificity domain-containing protein [Candidatus Natronoplasma sp.]